VAAPYDACAVLGTAVVGLLSATTLDDREAGASVKGSRRWDTSRAATYRFEIALLSSIKRVLAHRATTTARSALRTILALRTWTT
jgi:hypothetical protein